MSTYAMGITFTLQVLPTYYGRPKLGQVIALISGDGGNSPLEKPLWSNFDSTSDPVQIYLTLPELLSASD